MASVNPEPTPYQKLAANLKHLRANGASREEIQGEINRFKSKMDAVTREERRLSPAENVAAMGANLASGATFGLADEALGLVHKGTKDELRFLQNQFRDENPGEAIVMEAMGSLAMPLTALRAAPRAAGWMRKAATTMGEGAIQGGAAGFGNAEGDVLERMDETAKGATVGSVAAGAIGGAAKAASGTVRNALDRFGVKAPAVERTMERFADEIPDEDIAAGRQRLADLRARGLADEATPADVLPQGEAALRQAATSNRTVRQGVDRELRERSNRLANRADERLLEHTGARGESVDKSLAGLRRSAQDKSRPFYEAAEREAEAAPRAERLTPQAREELAAMGAKMPEGDEIDAALALPFVQKNVGRIKSAQAFKELPDDDHRVFDQLYKEIGEDIRLLQDKRIAKNMSTAERRELTDLIEQRSTLLKAIESRAASYPKALSEYAGDASAARAFERGSRVRDIPADMIPDELSSLDPANVPFFKRGAAEGFRSDVPAAELGDLGRFQSVLKNLGTKEQVQRFRNLYGDDTLKSYLGEILEMARMQGMKAGAGESTTVDKMLEQLQAEPEAITGMIAQVLRGNPMAAVAQFSPTNAIGRTLDRLRQSKSAQQRSDFLLQRGDDKVQAALDQIEQLRREGRLPRPRRLREPNPTMAAAREAGAITGRR